MCYSNLRRSPVVGRTDTDVFCVLLRRRRGTVLSLRLFATGAWVLFTCECSRCVKAWHRVLPLLSLSVQCSQFTASAPEGVKKNSGDQISAPSPRCERFRLPPAAPLRARDIKKLNFRRIGVERRGASHLEPKYSINFYVALDACGAHSLQIITALCYSFARTRVDTSQHCRWTKRRESLCTHYNVWHTHKMHLKIQRNELQ